MTIVKTILRKTDNGYRAEMLDWDNTILSGAKVDIFNRGLHGFPKGTLVYAIWDVKPSGRMFLKKAWEKKSPLSETTLLESRYSPEAETMVWLAADATRRLREAKGMKGVEFIETATGKVLAEEFTSEPKTTLKEMVEAMVTPEEEELAAVEQDVAEEEEAVSQPKDLTFGYHINHDARLVFTTVKKMSDANPDTAVKVMMVGPSGCGKTTLPRLFAQVVGKGFLRMNCASVRDPEEWFGYREARDGSTVFIRSPFIEAVEKGNLVVVLDEFNRLEPWLHNTLFPLLDDDGCTTIHGEEFRIGPGVIVVGTINSGYRYTGTFELDEALVNRFDFTLPVGFLPHAEEVKVLTERTGIAKTVADSLVKVGNQLRQHDIIFSTRSSLMTAAKVMGGMSLREAMEYTIIRRIPVESGSGNNLRKQAVDLVNVALSPLVEGEVEDDVFSQHPTKKKVEKKVEKEEAGLEGKVPYFHLRRNDEVEFLFLAVVRILRVLPVAHKEKLTMSDANDLADRIRNGEELYLDVTEKPSNLPLIVDEMRRSGLSGKFGYR